MEVFINECSLIGQFSNQYQAIDSFKSFLECLKLLTQLKSNKSVFKDSNFFYQRITADSMISSFLSKHKSINDLFVQNLNLLNPKTWQNKEIQNRKHKYMFNKKDFVGTSVAEIAARKHINTTYIGFLLNFSESEFKELLSFSVLIEDIDDTKIECIDNKTSLDQWLIDNGIVKPDEVYDVKGVKSPRDHQTVLKDTSVFELTTFPRNKNRKVFRRIGTNQLWSVDDKHFGPKAHIEVFDEKTRKHIGTSLYNKIEIDISKKVNSRSINLD